MEEWGGVCSSCTSARMLLKPDVGRSRALRATAACVRARVCARESVCVCVTGTELRQGRSESACSYSLAGSRSPLWTARVARDWRHAPKPVGWPRVTRESLTDDQTRAALARKVELNYMN